MRIFLKRKIRYEYYNSLKMLLSDVIARIQGLLFGVAVVLVCPVLTS